MASTTEENYLKALFNLTNNEGEIGISELSKELSVSKPTSTSMMKNLNGQGLVNYEKYKPIKLTAKGKKQAAMIVRKHRLTEMFLMEHMGFGWEEVHDVAEQIEHIKSDKFFDRMDELLDHPNVDPHGSPIPDKQGNIVWKSYVSLASCSTGQKVKLAALGKAPTELLDYLNSKDLALGTLLEIRNVEIFDGSIEISYTKHPKEIISQKVGQLLLVQEI